jgi:hypothetical protein
MCVRARARARVCVYACARVRVRVRARVSQYTHSLRTEILRRSVYTPMENNHIRWQFQLCFLKKDSRSTSTNEEYILDDTSREGGYL